MTEDKMRRGGLIGQVQIVDMITRSSSPWFSGPIGYVIGDAKKLPFVPCKGALGFFEVEA
jgi:hypothetical protein